MPTMIGVTYDLVTGAAEREGSISRKRMRLPGRLGEVVRRFEDCGGENFRCDVVAGRPVGPDDASTSAAPTCTECVFYLHYHLRDGQLSPNTTASGHCSCTDQL